MTVSFALDGLIVILLALTIGYAVVLNRRLKRLRDGEGELRATIDSFNKSTSIAEANLSRIKGIAEAAGAPRSLDAGTATAARVALAPLVEEARKLAADLDLLIARGDLVADNLEQTPVRGGGKSDNQRVQKPGRAGPGKGMDPELLDALRSVR